MMKEIDVYCKRPYKGLIDIRSHIVDKAIKTNTPIRVTVGSESKSKVFTPEELKENVVKKSKPFTSKFNNLTYKLFSYEIG